MRRGINESAGLYGSSHCSSDARHETLLVHAKPHWLQGDIRIVPSSWLQSSSRRRTRRFHWPGSTTAQAEFLLFRSASYSMPQLRTMSQG